MQNHNRPPASLLFIFGGSGDLNHRKLSPALYNLFIDDYLPEKFDIVGIGRKPYSDDDYRKFLLDGIQQKFAVIVVAVRLTADAHDVKLFGQVVIDEQVV